MEKKERIAELLKQKCVGKENAKTTSEIEKILAMHEDDPTNYQLRKLIKEIILDEELPIGSCSNGYYLIQDRFELDEVLDDLRGRIEGIRQRKRAIQKAFDKQKEEEHETQNSLF